MFNLSRFSTAIFKTLQLIKILALWQTYLTVRQVAPQDQPTQWKLCQHKEMPSFTWIFLTAQYDVTEYSYHMIYTIFLLCDISE